MSSSGEQTPSSNVQAISPHSPSPVQLLGEVNVPPNQQIEMEIEEGGGPSGGSLHDSLNELSPVYADSDSIVGETLSISEQPDSSITPPIGKQPMRHKASLGTMSSFGPMDSFEEKPPMELATKTRLKVKIKRLRMVGGWRWVDGKDDSCGICRTSFETCCMECKFPGDECPLVLGVCSHPFHMHCIVKWTNSQNGQKPACPLCRQEWKFATG